MESAEGFEPEGDLEMRLKIFSEPYRIFHGYFSVIWCSFAVVCNVLTVILLQHHTMKSTTNFLLCCTSTQQILLCTLYFVFAYMFYISDLRKAPNNLPLMAAYVFKSYVVLSTFCNMVLMWCTVTVAAFRLICIVFPHRTELCSMQRARIAVATVTFASMLCTIPAFLAHDVLPNPNPNPDPYPIEAGCAEIVNNSAINNIDARRNDSIDAKLVQAQQCDPTPTYDLVLSPGVLMNLTFWINAVVCKLVPSVLLGLLSILLVRRIQSANRKHQKLMKGDADQNDSRNRRTSRTTRLLATIAVLFAIVYFPQSTLEIIGAFSETFRTLYQGIGDLLDDLSLINNGVTFILHCAMSQQFRNTLVLVIITPIREFVFKQSNKSNPAATGTADTATVKPSC